MATGEGFLLDADLLSRLIVAIEYVEQLQKSGGHLPQGSSPDDRPNFLVVLNEDLEEGGTAEATVLEFDPDLDEWDDAGFTEDVREVLGTGGVDIPEGTRCWSEFKHRAGLCVTATGCGHIDPY